MTGAAQNCGQPDRTPEQLSAESVAAEVVEQADVMCPECGSDAWISHAFDLSRAYCLDCDHEWSR